MGSALSSRKRERELTGPSRGMGVGRKQVVCKGSQKLVVMELWAALSGTSPAKVGSTMPRARSNGMTR